MSNSLGYKVPTVLDMAPNYNKVFPDYLGFFKDIKTVSTIEEGLKSFDDLEEARRIKDKTATSDER